MPPIMDDETRTKLAEILSQMKDPVRVLLFTEKVHSPACKKQLEILSTVKEMSNKFRLEVYHSKKDKKMLKKFNIDKFPATVLLDKSENDRGIRFFGLTAGEEFGSFLNTVMVFSTDRISLEPELAKLVLSIKKPVNIKTFVTLTCPYCPKMVQAAHMFAYINPKITSEMIEGSQFPVLTQKYKVQGVPRVIINETTVLEGQHPPAMLFMTALKAADPEEYRRMEAAMRDMQGVRKVMEMEENRIYDVIIVGGGPAAMSAALYAARKNLDVGIVAEKLGGQMTFTASIENYLGFPGVTGSELIERFQFHMETYPVFEHLGYNVVNVKKTRGGNFEILPGDGTLFLAKSVVYCAGKEYSRLGVRNEDRFMGRGIAFCATCDAPLYTGRKVAVVGGANSAFTAVRDLLSFADEIHLIHRRTSFRADPQLVKEIKSNPKVKIHTPYHVVSFTGKDRLTGVKVHSKKKNETKTIKIDGVFLEIGLKPNSDPVKKLVTLNPAGEILTSADCSTSVDGFFAAGDVTDVSEKQISVAVGEGALASLSAYKYLVDNKLVVRKAGTDDDWTL